MVPEHTEGLEPRVIVGISLTITLYTVGLAAVHPFASS